MASSPTSPGSARTWHCSDARATHAPSDLRQIEGRPWFASTQARLSAHPPRASPSPSTQRPPGAQTQPATRQSASRKQGAWPAPSREGALPTLLMTACRVRVIRRATPATIARATARALPRRSPGAGEAGAGPARERDREGDVVERPGGAVVGSPPPAGRVGTPSRDPESPVVRSAGVDEGLAEKGRSVSGWVSRPGPGGGTAASWVSATGERAVEPEAASVIWERSPGSDDPAAGEAAGTGPIADEERGSPNDARYASSTAAPMARAEGQRSSRAKARARSTSATMGAGVSGAASASERAGHAAATSRSATWFAASCTMDPERRVKRVAPAAQRSDRASTSRLWPRACSGGMNAAVPSAAPARVAPSAAAVVLPTGGRGGGGASPGGEAAARDAEVEHLEDAIGREEEVLRLDVAVDDPLGVGRREHVAELVRERQDLAWREVAGRALGAHVERLALEQLHHQEGGAVVGHVVVDDAHRAGVPDGVGDVALAEEARAGVGVGGRLRVQHLHRDPVAVAVHAEVHRAHPPRAEHALERVLAAEHGADPALRALLEGGEGHSTRRLPERARRRLRRERG